MPKILNSRLEQAQARPHPSTEMGVGRDTLPLALELLIMVSFWEKERVFSKNVAPW